MPEIDHDTGLQVVYIALEVTLVALHGEKLNGNVEDALKRVRRAKDTINNRLNDKVCDGIGEGVD